MPDGVVHGFLRDAKEMSGQEIIREGKGPETTKLTLHGMQFGGGPRKLAQGGHQPVWHWWDGLQAPRQLADLNSCFRDQLGHAPSVGDFGGSFSAQLS